MSGAGVFLVTVPDDLRLVVTVDTRTGVVMDAEPAPPLEEGADDPPTVTRVEFVRDFVVRQILRDPAWGASMEAWCTGAEIRGLFRPPSGARRPGDVVELTKEQRAKVIERLKSPHESCRPVAPIAMFLVPWCDAFERAPEKKAV